MHILDSSPHDEHTNPPIAVKNVFPVKALGLFFKTVLICSSLFFGSSVNSASSSISVGPKFSKLISSSKILQSFAIAVAVIILSPVTIIMLTPAE